MSLFKRKRKKRSHPGFVVESGKMTSTGSSGATFIGHGSERDVEAYRSDSGTGESAFTPAGHNHITRDIKPYGQCPACDAYRDKHRGVTWKE